MYVYIHIHVYIYIYIYHVMYIVLIYNTKRNDKREVHGLPLKDLASGRTCIIMFMITIIVINDYHYHYHIILYYSIIYNIVTISCEKPRRTVQRPAHLFVRFTVSRFSTWSRSPAELRGAIPLCGCIRDSQRRAEASRGGIKRCGAIPLLCSCSPFILDASKTRKGEPRWMHLR